MTFKLTYYIQTDLIRRRHLRQTRGRRGEELVDHETERRGGHRVKGPAQSARPLHPDAMRAMGEHREERLAKWVEMKRKDDERLEESLE